MKKQALIIMAAALALLAADASLARGGAMAGRTMGPGDFGVRAPDSALQTRDMTMDRLDTTDRLQTMDRLQIRDPSALQDRLQTQDRTFDRLRIHQQ